MSKKTIHEFSASNIGSVRLMEDEKGHIDRVELVLEDSGGVFNIGLEKGHFKQFVYDLQQAKDFLLAKEKR